MQRQERVVAEGDLVILYLSKDNISSVVAKKGEVVNNRFGSFRHDDFIGLKYGSKVFANKGGGYMYILERSAELWTKALRHRTQILYTVDISIVCLYLQLKPGAVVAESGTGSGSLTTSMAKVVAPHGKVFTFEINKERAEAAR
jgi:tRNA (adenine57-N1/adenine58-N1)-methyltransferase